MLGFLCMVGLLFSSAVLAESQLTKLNVNPLVGGKFELIFEFNGDIGDYTDKLHYRPNKLVIDIDNASSVLKLNPISIDKNGIDTVKTERITDGLRIIISLETLMPYRVDDDGDRLLVRFGDLTSKSAVNNSNTNDDSVAALITAVAQNSGSQGVGESQKNTMAAEGNTANDVLLNKQR